MFPAAYRTVLYGGKITAATIAAQELLEMVRNETFSNVLRYNGLDTDAASFPRAAATGSCYDPLNPAEKGRNPEQGKLERWRETVRQLPRGRATVAVCVINPATPTQCSPTSCTALPSATTPNRLAQVSVVVQWNDAGHQGSVRLVETVAQPD